VTISFKIINPSVVMATALLYAFSLGNGPAEAVAICDSADAAAASVAGVDPSDAANLVSHALRASKLNSECAAYQASNNHSRLSLTYMATSFHNANVGAMGMHMEGDDHDASALLQLTLARERQSLHLAESTGQSSAADLLRQTMDETKGIDSRI
jgi:hypothetical protein